MSDGKYLPLLLESLQSHGISFDQKDLQKALETQNDLAIEAWIDEHLGPETLLSKEELLLYSALEKSGDSEVLASSQDLSFLTNVGDNDIESAVEQLQKSTVAIERQTEALRTQQEAVALLVKANGQNHAARAAAEGAQFRRWTTETNETKLAVDELLQNLKYQTAELTVLCKTADVELRKTASEILRVDDKILMGLQKLASDLDLGYQEEDSTANRIRDLCARLIKYAVESVRTRLDRIYLEAMVGRGEDPSGIRARDNAEIGALLDELESLYTEILPVAQMSVEQQYLEPGLRLIASHTVHDGDRSNKAIEYVNMANFQIFMIKEAKIEEISNCLSDLIDRLQDFTVHTGEYKSYRAATMLLANAVKTELDAERPPSPKTRQPSSPTRLRKQSKPISPVRPRNTLRRSSATSFDDDVNPELQILRNLGVSIPIEPTNEHNIATSLHDVLADRTIKLNGHVKSLQEVSEASIGSHLHDSKVTLQLLVDSLLSETQHKNVNLLDKEVQESMYKLEKVSKEMKRDIGAVNLDPLRQRNVRRDRLVERWG